MTLVVLVIKHYLKCVSASFHSLRAAFSFILIVFWTNGEIALLWKRSFPGTPGFLHSSGGGGAAAALLLCTARRGV